MTADRSRTTVEFEVRHLWGLHTIRGRFRRCDGSYVVGPAGSAIELTIDAASVDTANAERKTISGRRRSHPREDTETACVRERPAQ